MKKKKIGNIGNYYGALFIKKKGGEYFWSIENYDGCEWEEIPKNLFDALVDYEKHRFDDKEAIRPPRG